MSRITLLLTPPVFDVDEERTYNARLLYVILWTLIPLITLVGLAATIVLPVTVQRWLLLASIVDITSLGLLAMTRSGYTRLASLVLVMTLWSVATISAATAGGIHAPAVFGYLLVVSIAGLLLGSKGGAITGAICGLTGLGMVYAEIAGVLPPNQVQNTPLSLWIANVFYITIIISLQSLATNTIKNALQRAQQELTERRQTQDALRASEMQYRMLIEESPTGIALVSLQDQILMVNPAACQSLGYSSEDLIGKQATT